MSLPSTISCAMPKKKLILVLLVDSWVTFEYEGWQYITLVSLQTFDCKLMPKQVCRQHLTEASEVACLCMHHCLVTTETTLMLRKNQLLQTRSPKERGAILQSRAPILGCRSHLLARQSTKVLLATGAQKVGSQWQDANAMPEASVRST